MIKGLDAVVLIVKDFEKIGKKLKEKGFDAYRENYQNADGNLFHFNTED